MKISFRPALGDTVDLPSTASLLPVHLHFSAELSATDFQSLTADGGILQLWTDIPVGDSFTGDWHAHDYGLNSQHVKVCDGSASNVSGLGENDGTVHLSLCVPISSSVAANHKRFSYTFRIVYPGRQIEWLGQYGQNGFICLQRSPQVHLASGWIKEDEQLRWEGPNDEVARVDNLDDYSIWSFGLGERFGESDNPSLLFLIPKERSKGPYVDSLVFCATPGAAMVLSPSGSITSTGSGSLGLYPLSRHSGEPLLVTEHATRVSRVVAFDTDKGHLILASPSGHHTTTFIALPLYTTPLPMQLNFKSHFQPFLPSSTTHFILYQPLTSESRFFSIPSAVEDDVSFAVDNAGDCFIFASIYDLASPTGKIAVSILSPHSIFRPSSNPFPTPPPSPFQLRDVLPITNLNRRKETSSVLPQPDQHSQPAGSRSSSRPTPGNTLVSKLSHVRVPQQSRLFSLATFMLVIFSATLLVAYRITKAILGRYLNWSGVRGVQDSPAPQQCNPPQLPTDTTSNTKSNATQEVVGHNPDSVATIEPAPCIEVDMMESQGRLIIHIPFPKSSGCPIKIVQDGQQLEITMKSLNDSFLFIEFERNSPGLVCLLSSAEDPESVD